MSMRKVADLLDTSILPTRQVKVHYFTETKEYRARLYLDGRTEEAADYFTGDKQDALDTANVMLLTRSQRASKREREEPSMVIDDIDTSVSLLVTKPTPRNRPRGYHAKPSKLLAGLFARVGK